MPSGDGELFSCQHSQLTPVTFPVCMSHVSSRLMVISKMTTHGFILPSEYLQGQHWLPPVLSPSSPEEEEPLIRAMLPVLTVLTSLA